MNNVIHVLDSLPGSGKSVAAINYINAHPDTKFLLVCELLEEVERFSEKCGMASPQHAYKKPKSSHIVDLLEDNKNIACTHALLLSLNSRALELIANKDYVLIIDEVLNPFVKESDYTPNDFKRLHERGEVIVDSKDGQVSYLYDEPEDTKYRPFKDACDTGQLVAIVETGQLLHRLPVQVFRAAKRVTIMTYMFSDSVLDIYLRSCGFEIVTETELHVQKDQKEYGAKIKSLLQIKNNKQVEMFREIYRSEKALSRTFFKKIDQETSKGESGKGTLKDGLRKVIESCARDSKSTHKTTMYAVYSDYAAVETNKTASGSFDKRCIRPNKLSAENCFVPFNKRGVNKYSDRNTAIFAVNIFLDPNFKKYLSKYYDGVYVDQDKIALSFLIQWLFRGCIRLDEAEPMDVYVVSERMEKLLIDWINERG